MAGYSTKIVAEAVNPEGKVMSRLTIENMELTYPNLINVEQPVRELVNEYFDWGLQKAAEPESK
jgi:predicted methyltransferase